MAFPEDIISGIVPYDQQKRYPGMQLTVETDAFGEPLSDDEIIEHFKLPSASAEMAKLRRLCKAARKKLESMYAIVPMDSAYIQTMDNVNKVIELGVRPVLSVQAIEYIADLNIDTWLVFASTGYSFIAGPTTGPAHRPQVSKIVARSTWPSHRGLQSFRIKFRAGFKDKGAGDAAAIAAAQLVVPDDLKTAILMLAYSMYEGRGGELSDVRYEQQVQRFSSMPPGVVELMENYQDWGI